MEPDSLPMRDYEVKDEILEFMRKSPGKLLYAGNIAATFNEEDDVDIHRVNALLAEMRSYGFVEWAHRRNPHINMITPTGITFVRDKGGYSALAFAAANKANMDTVDERKKRRREKRERIRDWVFGGMILILTVLQILQITGVL